MPRWGFVPLLIFPLQAIYQVERVKSNQVSAVEKKKELKAIKANVQTLISFVVPKGNIINTTTQTTNGTMDATLCRKSEFSFRCCAIVVDCWFWCIHAARHTSTTQQSVSLQAFILGGCFRWWWWHVDAILFGFRYKAWRTWRKRKVPDWEE